MRTIAPVASSRTFTAPAGARLLRLSDSPASSPQDTMRSSRQPGRRHCMRGKGLARVRVAPITKALVASAARRRRKRSSASTCGRATAATRLVEVALPDDPEAVTPAWLPLRAERGSLSDIAGWARMQKHWRLRRCHRGCRALRRHVFGICRAPTPPQFRPVCGHQIRHPASRRSPRRGGCATRPPVRRSSRLGS
jgi:hypothetical protein